jgi:hypothetical protein
MKYIRDGGTPNLMSLARVLGEDDQGLKGLAIFTDAGAVRFRAYPKVAEEVQKIVDALVEADLIEGYTEMKNGVYQQTFVGSGGCGGEEAYAVTSMYASRVPLSSGEEVIGMLVSAGVTEEALVKGVRQGSIKGLPPGINETEVRRFFEKTGKDVEQIKGEIIHAPLREPLDYDREEAKMPGEVLVIDAFDPSFSRMKGVKGPIKSLGGYRDAVIGVDAVSGVIDVIGRRSPKNPEKVVKVFMDKWIGRWKNLRVIKVDSAFATEAVMAICEKEGIRLRQAVPGEHRRGTGEAEGAIRWLQDQGQVNMNRAVQLARSGRFKEFGEKEARTLWYHAVRCAMYAALMKPCLHREEITRFQERCGRIFNLSDVVMLPFALPMVVRNRVAGQDGRGSAAVYIGPSAVVRSGIITFLVESKRVQQKYSFVPRERMPLLNDLDVARIARDTYGEIVVKDENDDKLEGRPELIKVVDPGETRHGVSAERDFGSGIGVDGGPVEGSEGGDGEVQLENYLGKANHEKEKDNRTHQHHHFTRSKTRAMAVETRPPKPEIPEKRIAMKMPEWQKAMARELEKINAEDTIHELPKDDRGEVILPEDAIIMRMFEILDYKWKMDPETGQERWMEVIRAVVDGSTDKK